MMLSQNKHKKQQGVKVFRAQVSSPRIVWFQFKNYLMAAMKLCFALLFCVGLFLGLREAIDYTFHRNPEFQLKRIRVNPNAVFDELGLVERLNIDLKGNIFQFDLDQYRSHLENIHSIQGVKIERKLPGELIFHVTPRTPVAWIFKKTDEAQYLREVGNFLVDESGYLFSCCDGLLPEAQKLPILLLTENKDFPLKEGSIEQHPDFQSTIRLLKSVKTFLPNEMTNFDTISLANAWSLDVRTQCGTKVTFGLGDHERQLAYFSEALKHAQRRDYAIEHINLIPTRNIPITVR